MQLLLLLLMFLGHVHEERRRSTAAAGRPPSERPPVRRRRHEDDHGDDEHEQHAPQESVSPPRRSPVLAEQHDPPHRAHQRQRLDSVSSSIPSSLPSHELERIAKATHHACDESKIPPLPILQVGRERRPRHADHGVVEEPDVEGDADGEAGEGEVEECRVHHHVGDALPERVPLVVGGEVERRREEGVAHAGEGDDAEAQEGVRSEHLNVKFFFFQKVFCVMEKKQINVVELVFLL
jgi:hypothetical protein